MKKLNKILILLILFQIISAVPAGISLITDPSGENLGLPIRLLENSPFNNYLIPGLFLFLILGIFPIIILYGLIKKPSIKLFEKINLFKEKHWSITFSYYLGIILVLWINMQQLFIKEWDILQFVYSTLGITIIFISNLKK